MDGSHRGERRIDVVEEGRGTSGGRAFARLLGTAGSRVLWIWLLALCLLRVLFLVAALDPEEERVMTYLDPAGVSWRHGPERPLFDREELYTATAAEAIRHHLGLPFSRYRFMPYASGSLLLSLLAVPVYATFGPHYLAFKLIPLAVTVLGGLFWLLFVRAWKGEGAALVFGALYLFAPPTLVRTALISKGDHPEAMMILGAVLLVGTLAARASRGASDLRPRILWGAAGLLAGFGIYVTYSTAPILAAAALAVLLRTRFRPLSLHLAALAGFALGLLPWLANLAASGGQALRVYGRPLGAMVDPGTIGSRLGLLFSQGLLARYDLGGAAVPIAGAVFLAGVALGWIALWRDRRDTFAALVLLATGAHLLAFLLMAPDASSRYLVPGYPLFMIALLVPALGRRGPRPLRWFPVAAVLLGLISQAAVVAGSGFACLRGPLKGTDWPLLGEVLGGKLRAEEIRPLPSEVRPFLWIGYGKRTFYDTARDRWGEAAGAAGEDAPKVWEGIGMSWAESGALAGMGPMLRNLTFEQREALKRGVTNYGEVIFGPLFVQAGARGVASFLDTFDPEDRPALRLALARTLAMMTVHAPEAVSRNETEAGSRLLDPAEAWYGAGWAQFRSASGARTRWKMPSGSWPAALLAGGIPSEAGYWNGLGEAWIWHLERRSPRWILGGAAGPVPLARELTRLTAGRGGPEKGILAWSAGRGTAAALVEPFAAREIGFSLSAWPWRTALPPDLHAAFQEGLAFGGVRRAERNG